jgi:hypothetical protein
MDNGAFRVLTPPEPSEWQMRCSGVVYRPSKGKEPNGFHRLMQRLAFGFRWERVNGAAERAAGSGSRKAGIFAGLF